ncbi:MAG: hypothetical protein Q9169_004749 [Polycauliona sp. 2 TL-2023]
MVQKRKAHPSAANNAQSKRHRLNNAETEEDANPTTKAQVDPTYGQRSAFPGLEGPLHGDDLFYGPAEDGLEYLRMVRSEAKGVPNLLTSASFEETNIYQDYSRGYYDDGAYTAMPLPRADGMPEVDGGEDIDPQEAYYTNLCDQFRSLHTALHAASPRSAPDDSTTAMASKLNHGASSRIWRMTVLYTQPTSILLSLIDQDTVIAGIAALEKHIAWKTLEKDSYLGAWAWGLLARCRDIGMMGSEEVGVIRELGKKARAMVRLLAAGLGGAQGASIVENEDEDERDGEVLEDEDGVERYEDDHAHGMTDEETANQMKSVEGNHEDQDIESLRPTNPAYTTQNGDVANPSERNGSTFVPDGHESNHDHDEMVEAQERLLTTLHQTNASPPDALTTSSNGQLSSSPQEKGPNPADHIAKLIPQRSSSPAKASIPFGSVPRTMRVAATLDMIITIAGEVYGQRDLLEGRLRNAFIQDICHGKYLFPTLASISSCIHAENIANTVRAYIKLLPPPTSQSHTIFGSNSFITLAFLPCQDPPWTPMFSFELSPLLCPPNAFLLASIVRKIFPGLECLR